MPNATITMRERIKTLLLTNNVALEEAILRIYGRQTAGEQSSQTTVEHNGMGFSAFDATILSSFAEQIQRNRYGKPKGERLTEKQRVIGRRKMVRYTGQLAIVAAEKEAAKAADYRAAGYHRCGDGEWRQIPRSADGVFEGLCGVCESACSEYEADAAEARETAERDRADEERKAAARRQMEMYETEEEKELAVAAGINIHMQSEAF
jgi:hypothetical protein